MILMELNECKTATTGGWKVAYNSATLLTFNQLCITTTYANEQRQTSLQFCLHPEPPAVLPPKICCRLVYSIERIKRKGRPSLSWIELGAHKFMIKLSSLGFQNHILVYCSAAKEYCLVPAGCRTVSSPTQSMSPIRESVCWTSAAQNILAVVG